VIKCAGERDLTIVRVIAAALTFVALVLIGDAAWAQGAFASGQRLAQNAPQTGAASEAFTPPPKGAPHSRIGADSREIGGRRIALVIGKGTYKLLPRLDNPVADARLMTDTLQSVGF